MKNDEKDDDCKNTEENQRQIKRTQKMKNTIKNQTNIKNQKDKKQHDEQ